MVFRQGLLGPGRSGRGEVNLERRFPPISSSNIQPLVERHLVLFADPAPGQSLYSPVMGAAKDLEQGRSTRIFERGLGVDTSPVPGGRDIPAM